MLTYSSRRWLNKPHSVSTGSVVAFDGMITSHDTGNKYRCTFLQISDCSVSARLVVNPDDSIDDFVEKLDVLLHEINNFKKHLKDNNGR